jgi:AraC family transcriptional regulator of adaptative response/methylated-DNA-[protein]-cysteine methyltransferase
VQYCIVDSTLGRLLVAGTDKGICSVAMSASDRTLEHALADEMPRGSKSATTTPGWRSGRRRSKGSRQGARLAATCRSTSGRLRFSGRCGRRHPRKFRAARRAISQVAKAIGRPRAVRARWGTRIAR